MTASQAQGQIKADQGVIFQVNLYQATMSVQTDTYGWFSKEYIWYIRS